MTNEQIMRGGRAMLIVYALAAIIVIVLALITNASSQTRTAPVQEIWAEVAETDTHVPVYVDVNSMWRSGTAIGFMSRYEHLGFSIYTLTGGECSSSLYVPMNIWTAQAGETSRNKRLPYNHVPLSSRAAPNLITYKLLSYVCKYGKKLN